MQIQKLNNIYSNCFTAKENTATKPSENVPKYREKKDYEYLKENLAESFLMVGSGFACGDMLLDNNASDNIKKTTSKSDKILIGAMAVCLLVGIFQTIKAIIHYIIDKKNGEV